MKKILFLLCFLSISAHAVEIKLTCQASYKQTINGILQDSKNGNLDVTIIEQKLDKTFRTIVLKGLTTLSASTIPSNDSFDQSDLSNENRWLLSNKMKINNDLYGESRTTIEINRNTGSIISNSFSNVLYEGKNNFVEVEVIGSCSKVDTTKRKF